MKPIRGPRLHAGVVLTHPVRHGLTTPAAKSEDHSGLRIEEPLRFHLARYEHLTRHLQGKFNLAAVLLTGLILLVLGWRAQCGESVSPERWLCGALSGWFILAMTRLALFTCLAAPRFICYAQGKLQVSGLGTLRTEQILHWSIEHQVMIRACAKPCAKFQISCRWHGCERHWTMLMEEGRETERLQHLLEVQLPCSAHTPDKQLRTTIQIEAGVLSQ
jgi:hypothetical protein